MGITGCYRRLLTLLLLLFATGQGKGQSHYFTHYQVENGLSNNAVICSLQDQMGFLWFGTKDGLNRFDGYSFKIFRNDAADTNSVGSNYIYSLHEASNGVLWVGCDRGLFSYHAATESFSRVPGSPFTEILDIQEDKQGYVWFISRQILYRYHPARKQLIAFNEPRHLNVTSVCMTRNGLWVSSSNGSMYRLYENGADAKAYDVFDVQEKAISNWIEKIYDAGDGFIMVGTARQGVKWFDTNTGTYKDILSHTADNPEIFVRDFIRQSETEYWIATESGIFIYNSRTGKSTQLRKNYDNPWSISDNAIYTFCRDKEGGIWAGTYFGGLNYYPRQYTSFQKYFPQSGSNSISGNAVREIVRDENGNLWIGTEDAGLNKLQVKTGQFTHYNTGRPHHASPYNIHGLMVYGHELWVGTFHRGLDILDTRTGQQLRHYSAATHNLLSDFVYCFLTTRDGKLIVGTDRGLLYYNRKRDDFDIIKEAPENFYTILYEDQHGTIWAGTYADGVHWFNPKTGKRGHYRYEPSRKGSLGGDRVNWIFEDSRQQLWMATEGGLCLFDPATQQFRVYTTKQGFPSNIIYAVLEDAQHDFWASTSKGLARFTPSSGKVAVFTKANGLLNDQFNYNSAYKDQHGNMYFGSVKGMISFHPVQFVRNDFVLPVYITGFQVYDKELAINKSGSPLRNSVTFTKEITLSHNQSSFSIDFAALSYTAPDMTEYAYKMEGLNKEWSYLKTNRKAYFTKLSPGTYTFTVRASNADGQWNSQPATLVIRVLPPFWASAWAYLLYTAIVSTVIILLVRRYHRRTQEKNHRKLEILEHEKEKEIYQAKIEFFTNVAHEIRTPLTLIKGPMEKVMKQIETVPLVKGNLQIMNRNIDRLLDLTTQLLDFRKTETKGFSLNFVKAEIRELVTDAYMRFKPAAEQKRLKFTMEQPGALYAYVDREAFNKVISNLLDNALKYAESRIHIRLFAASEKENRFRLEISNDGQLIPLDMKEKIFEGFFRINEDGKQSGTGIGLALARSLAELHKGSLTVDDPQDDMNVFVLVLPIHQDIEFNLSR